MSSSLPNLPDKKTRDDATRLLSDSIFVEAGAGVGKTKTLVDRFVSHILMGHCEVENILAITFTRAATAEISLRVRQELTSASTNTKKEDKKKALALKALENFDLANIRTIDGFASWLVSRHSVKLNLPFKVQTIDQSEFNDLIYKRWQIFLDDHFGAKSTFNRSYQTLLLLNYKNVMGRLYEVAQKLSQNYGVVQNLRAETNAKKQDQQDPKDQKDIYEYLQRAKEVLLKVLEVTTEEEEEEDDKLKDYLVGSLFPLLEELTKPNLSKEDLYYILGKSFEVGLKRGLGKKEFWEKLKENEPVFSDLSVFVFGKKTDLSGKDVVTLFVKKIFDFIEHFILTLADKEVSKLTTLLCDFVDDFTEYRWGVGKLIYSDYVFLALKLLKKEPFLAQLYRDKFKAVLVDEWQDTSQAQAELIKLVAGGSATLFLVGDQKQSIYSFRGAVPTNNLDGMFSNLRTLPLTTNFRSTKEVVKFINTTFSKLLEQPTEDGLEEDEIRYTPLVALEKRGEDGTDTGDLSSKVYCLGGIKSLTSKRELYKVVDEARFSKWLQNTDNLAFERVPLVFQKNIYCEKTDSIGGDTTDKKSAWPIKEGSFVLHKSKKNGEYQNSGLSKTSGFKSLKEVLAKEVLEIARLVKMGGFEISSEKTTRRSKISDLCVIAPKRSDLSLIIENFSKEKINYLLDQKSEKSVSIKAYELQRILSALADPQDEIAVIASLRTSALGCSDRDLYQWRKANKTFDYVYEDTKNGGDQSVVSKAMARLNKLCSLSIGKRAFEVAEMAVREFGLREIALLSNSRPYAELAQIDSLISTTQEIEDKTLGTFSEVIKRLNEYTDATAYLPEDREAAYLSTIHSLKGLEFPIVVVFDWTSLPKASPEYIFDEETKTHFGWRIKHGSTDSLDWHSKMYDRSKKHSEAVLSGEQKRLFYVACTRARDHLFVYTTKDEVKSYNTDINLSGLSKLKNGSQKTKLRSKLF